MIKKGRPSSFKEEFIKQAAKLCEIGATDQEIAEFFEVDVRTLYRWKKDKPAFCQALKAGKDVADDRVERSLFQRAVGYEQDEVKIFMPAGASAPVYAPFRAKIPADTTSMIFWLKNRRPEQWRDKTEHVVRHEVSHMSDDDLARIAAGRSEGTSAPEVNSTKLN